MPVSFQGLLVGAVAAFTVFLAWKYRPRLGRAVRRPPSQEVRLARERARSAGTRREKAEAFVAAAEAAAREPAGLTAAMGYFFRAMKADPAACEPIAGLRRLLERRHPERLEAVLWRRLAILPWSGDTANAARCAAEGLTKLYARRLRHRDRARVIERLAERIG
jgi:hypothetical protein